MAYHDPYASKYAAGSQDYYQGHQPSRSQTQRSQSQRSQTQPQYGESSGYTSSAGAYVHADAYDDSGPAAAPPDYAYNPYISTEPGKPRRADEEEEYVYGSAYDKQQLQQQEYGYPPVQRSTTQRSTGSQRRQNSGSGFGQEEFRTPAPPPREKTARSLREYRYDHQGNLWTKGSRGRCVGRFCCCTLMTFIVLLVSIILALALYVRPPSIQIGAVEVIPGPDGNPIQQEPDGLKINLGVNISVTNPNYFSVDFDKIQADITYPVGDVPIGGGLADEVVIRKSSETNFTFPFFVNYNSTLDPQSSVIIDIASKCGVPSGQKSDLIVNYKITLGIRLLFVTISPTISNKFNFLCPLSEQDISKFLIGGKF